MSTEVVLWFAGIVTEASLIGLLLYRGVQRRLPIFTAYCVWDVSSNSLVYLAFNHVSRAAYSTIYLTQTVIDSILVFCVLIEVAHSVLKPLGSSLARRASTAVAIGLLLLGTAAWWFAVVPGAGAQTRQLHWILDLQQATSITRILFFVALAASSRLLSLGMGDRELQVATGFGVYSLASMVIEILKSHPEFGLSFRLLNEAIVATFDATLVYWILAFSRNDKERRPISPQMQELLIGLAGHARRTRSAMKKPGSTGDKIKIDRD
ncbi:MAG: hypothetical protein KGN79_14160 [Acidobacteriota bacterium]|nr:hypothetical protein [Acidobacteriota bacterium]